MKKIFLSNGGFTLVSDEDYIFLSGYNWCLINNKGYIHARVDGKNTRMSRIIAKRMSLDIENKEIDHIDRNPFNNQRSNLRVATHSQNLMNARCPKHNTSGFKGVYWNEKRQKWYALIQINNQKIHLGSFENIENAIARRRKAEIEYFGEYRHDPTEELGLQ